MQVIDFIITGDKKQNYRKAAFKVAAYWLIKNKWPPILIFKED